MTPYAMRLQQPVHPEAVASVNPLRGSTLNGCNLDRSAKTMLGTGAKVIEQCEQSRTITSGDAVLAGLLLARYAGGHNPPCEGELQRHENRGAHVAGYGIVRGERLEMDVRCSASGVSWLGGNDLNLSPTALHPHRILDSSAFIAEAR